MPDLKDKLIVALDVDSLEKAKELVDLLYPTVRLFKVGSALVVYCESLIKYIKEKGGRVFLDLKWYDIPNTIYVAVSTGTACSVDFTNKAGFNSPIDPVIFMMTLHTQGSEEMLKKAVQAAEDKARELNIRKPFIVGVTELTSESSENVENIVLERARKAKRAGLDGVVCSVHEAAMIRKEFGEDFIIVTPGIRPKGYPINDQLRTATPKEAVEAGANFIVVGRPILQAKDPLKVVKEIINE